MRKPKSSTKEDGVAHRQAKSVSRPSEDGAASEVQSEGEAEDAFVDDLGVIWMPEGNALALNNFTKVPEGDLSHRIEDACVMDSKIVCTNP